MEERERAGKDREGKGEKWGMICLQEIDKKTELRLKQLLSLLSVLVPESVALR